MTTVNDPIRNFFTDEEWHEIDVLVFSKMPQVGDDNDRLEVLQKISDKMANLFAKNEINVVKSGRVGKDLDSLDGVLQ
tara:strand:+ start:1281 stop:1514 length:234 start_codon:yes stop_codon:yes gene_type:complete